MRVKHSTVWYSVLVLGYEGNTNTLAQRIARENTAKVLVSPVPTFYPHQKPLTGYHSNFLIRRGPHTNSTPRNGGGPDFLLPPSTPPFAKFSLIGRYLSKSLGTTRVPVQGFALQVFCRHLYQYICYCQYFSLVPLDPRELCERGCTWMCMAKISLGGGSPEKHNPEWIAISFRLGQL